MLVPDEVQTFLAVLRTGNLAKAAEGLHVSQSSASYRLAALEKRLGHRLFDRSRGGSHASLTAKGQQFQSIAERWELLFAETSRLHSNHRLHISLGAVHALARHFLPPLYRRLADRGPDIALSLRTGTGPQLSEQVLKGDLHAAFILYQNRQSDLNVRRVFTSPVKLVHHGAPPEALPDSVVPLSALSRDREIQMYQGDTFDQWRSDAELHTAKLSSDSVLTLPPLLGLPGAWCLLPEFAAEDIAAESGCTVWTPQPSPPPQGVYYITRKHRVAAVHPELQLIADTMRGLWGRGE